MVRQVRLAALYGKKYCVRFGEPEYYDRFNEKVSVAVGTKISYIREATRRTCVDLGGVYTTPFSLKNGAV